MTTKKAVGITMLVLSVLVFLLSCIPSFLNIGKFFQGVFGILIYPLCLLTALIGVALIMGLRYTFDKKYTAYLLVAAVCILMLLHTIFTSGILYDKYTAFKNFGEYLKACYYMESGITVGGVLFGLLVFLIRGIIGLGGTYALFAILATLFVGLTIDYAVFNKGKRRKPADFAKRDIEQKEKFEKALGESEQIGQSFQTNPVQETFDNVDSDIEAEAMAFTPMFETKDEKVNSMLAQQEDVKLDFNLQRERINSVEHERAKNVLFGSNKQEQEEQPASDQKSARDILFGNRPNVPNIFESSSRDRDNWKRQYASRTLGFTKDEQDEQEQNEQIANNESSNFNETEDGSIVASWGTYRPTNSINRDINRQERINRSETNFFENKCINNQPSAPQNSSSIDKSERISASRENRLNLRERNTISSINQSADNDFDMASSEFSSRLSSREDRRRAGDLLADASTLGININKEEQDKKPETFSSILDNSRQRPEIRNSFAETQSSFTSEKPKVEKISFENQLNQKYSPPPTNVLNLYKEEHVDYSAEYKEKSEILENTLSNFKIPAKVINVVRGPKVTRYELNMPMGISVSKVLSYDKDISMNLASRSGIRIEAPIPGKNAFGVEVENDKSSMVGFRELVESPEFVNFKGPLPVAIGKNISGEVIIKSLAKMVHILVAGSTGSGKSVFLHSLIMSLMYKHSPEELRFIMIDPKRVEFARYNRMPHMMLPEIVTECSKAVNALAWAVKEMERRYQLLVDNNCQKIEQFNECRAVKEGREKKLPYLVIVVDELAELMSVAAKDVELKIQRITQLGRASGIHMVIATQRPSVNIVTGTIKNNLPTRIAFSLASAIDSGTIINQGGAEKLLGQGDMLLSAQDSNQLVRLQAAFVSDEEIEKTLTYIKAHNISVYDEEIQKSIYSEPENEKANDNDDDKTSPDERMDEYMPQALKLVMKNGKASISMIQRRFSVGYARAARIIDQMETRGFIDGGFGNKPRDVKITMEEFNELFGDVGEE